MSLNYFCLKHEEYITRIMRICRSEKLQNFHLWLSKVKSNLNQCFPSQVILTSGKQPKFLTNLILREETKEFMKRVFISLARDSLANTHCHSSEWLSAFVAKNHLGECVKNTDSWIRPSLCIFWSHLWWGLGVSLSQAPQRMVRSSPRTDDCRWALGSLNLLKLLCKTMWICAHLLETFVPKS